MHWISRHLKKKTKRFFVLMSIVGSKMSVDISKGILCFHTSTAIIKNNKLCVGFNLPVWIEKRSKSKVNLVSVTWLKYTNEKGKMKPWCTTFYSLHKACNTEESEQEWSHCDASGSSTELFFQALEGIHTQKIGPNCHQRR